jgi:Family of unknown function (DUF6600)
MKTIKTAVIVLALLIGLGTAQPAKAGVSFSIGTGDFYLSVGNYDYLPYAYSTYPQYAPPRINFYDAMSDYGNWVSVQPFGQVWRPYVDAGWRPYVNGHWVNTRYGLTWSGYEPWAWAGYHYGNWIYTRDFGWAWIPGYDWHPGRVAWSQGSGTIGWSPLPPNGYDYSRGYLSYRGQYNQYTYNDPDFYDYDNSNQYYGGPYYDSGYRDMYYNPSYQNVSINLWVFVGRNNFGYDNYADYYLDRDYTQNVFQRRLVRISSRPLQVDQVERIIKQPIRRVDVEEKEIQTDRQKIKVVIPQGEEDNVRKNANRTVREVIAPAFAEKHKAFKGEKAQNERAVAKVFRQENRQPKVETVDSDELVRKGRQDREAKQVKRQQITKQEVDQVIKVEKQAKQPKARKADVENQRRPEPGTTPDLNKDQQFEKNRPEANDRERQQNNARDIQRQKEKDIEQQKQRDIQNQKQRDFDQQRKKDIDQQKQVDAEQQRQRDIEQQKQRNRDMEQQKQRDIEQQKQRDFDQQKQRDMEKQRQRDIDQQKQREIDQQTQRDVDQQRQKDREQPNDQELKKQSDRERDADKQKQDEEQSKSKKDKNKKTQTQTKPNDDSKKDEKKNRNRS